MIIRKVEDHVGKNYCCDANDVCEEQVTHFVCKDDGQNKLWYCGTHVEPIRDTLINTLLTPS